MSVDQFTTLRLQAATGEALETLRGFAEFWKVPYEDSQVQSAHQVTMSSGLIPDSAGGGNPTVVSPLGDDNARKVSERFNLDLDTATSLIHLPFSPGIWTSIRTKVYNFKSAKLKPLIDSNGIPILSRLDSTNLSFLALDLASTFDLLLSRGLEDPPSVKFKIATRLPLSYRMIPSFVRNRAFKKEEEEGVRKENIGPIECLRVVFLASLLTAAELPLPLISFWGRGKTFGAAVTHDVETGEGLTAGSKHLLRAENELGVRSTWNVVSNRYPLTHENLEPLARSGEIGAHDTNHDGRLIFLSPDSRTSRLRDCRETLEKISGSEVRGFRAPLLQHDRRLLGAVGKAGYTCDSSVPSWELLSPTSLKSHGVGTVFPLNAEGVVEVPVSLPQDHQLLRVRELGPSEAADVLIRESRWVREIGGMCTLLVHPDYDFATEQYIDEYSRVLRTFREDSACQMMTLREAADWWSHRHEARLEVSDDGKGVKLVGGEEHVELHVRIARRFDKNGFVFGELS